MSCPSNIEKIIQVKGQKDPCPAVGKGSFKKANVCKTSPYVYYTPVKSIEGYKESIQDLVILDKFDADIKKFFMTAKCSLPNIPKKSNHATVIVDKMVSIPSYIKENPSYPVVDKFISFIDRFLKQVVKYNPEDIWEMMSTDLKTDNVMINPENGNMYITDFSPARHRDGDYYSFISTPIFTIMDDIKDFSYSKKYTKKQISVITLDIFILTALTTLYHIYFINENLKKKLSVKVSEDRAFDMLEKIPGKRSMNLNMLQREVLKALRKLDGIDMGNVESWTTVKIGKRRATITRTRVSRSANKCEEILSLARSSKVKVTNPLTGRTILRKGAAFNKLVRNCS